MDEGRAGFMFSRGIALLELALISHNDDGSIYASGALVSSAVCGRKSFGDLLGSGRRLVQLCITAVWLG